MIFVCILATYAMTLMLTASEGPYGVFARLRANIRVLECFLCTSVWVGGAVAVYLAQNPIHWLVLTLGLSGGAVAIEYITLRRSNDGK